MEHYELGSIFLDISIGLLVLGVVIRLILTLTYFKRNDSRQLTEPQQKTIRRVRIPVTAAGLFFAVAAMILLLIH